jgi:hypothetical protein
MKGAMPIHMNCIALFIDIAREWRKLNKSDKLTELTGFRRQCADNITIDR